MPKTIEEALESVEEQWKPGVFKLRQLFLTTELKEELKWGIPNYTLNGKLVAGIGAFKSYFGVWFHHGVFLSDPSKKLINAQKGKTKGMRQWRFTDNDFDAHLVMSYILEAIENQKAGKEIKPAKPKTSGFPIPPELSKALASDAALKQAYNSFTPFKRKEFCEYIGEAKRESTRLTRLEKCIEHIRMGEGLNDKYR